MVIVNLKHSISLVLNSLGRKKGKNVLELSELVIPHLALTVSSFIHLLTMTNCALSLCQALTDLGTEEIAMNQTKISALKEFIHTLFLGKLKSSSENTKGENMREF